MEFIIIVLIFLLIISLERLFYFINKSKEYKVKCDNYKSIVELLESNIKRYRDIINTKNTKVNDIDNA